MNIDLTPKDREIILEALYLAQQDELNGLNYSDDESFKEEKLIRKKYLKLNNLLSKKTIKKDI